MTSIKSASLAFALALAAVGSAVAKEKEAPAAAKPGGGMTMMDMMGKSNTSCLATSDSLESLGKAVQEAIKSDDKAKMKAALQRTEAHIAQMKVHMSTCMDMMSMMGGMMGGGMMGGGKAEGGMMGGGMMGGRMQGEDKGATPEKKEDAAEHDKHHPK